jgi:hypothetical protein
MVPFNFRFLKQPQSFFFIIQIRKYHSFYSRLDNKFRTFHTGGSCDVQSGTFAGIMGLGNFCYCICLAGVPLYPSEMIIFDLTIMAPTCRLLQ